MKMLLKLVKTKWSNTTKSVVFISSFLSPRNNSTSASGQRISLAYDLNDKFSSRRALVISHGLFASKATWRAMARRVNEATRQRIYTVDMRNHGNSMPYVDNMNYFEMAGDLEKFINEIVVGRDKCEHVSLMGHSMGGKASMTLVLSDNFHAKHVDKLIVADISPTTSPSLHTIGIILDKLCSIDLTQLSSNIFTARKQVDARLSEIDFLKNDVNQRQFLLTRFIEVNGKPAWGFNLHAIRNHAKDVMEFPAFTKRFERPTLFLGGELSNYISDSDKPAIEKYFSNYNIATIPKAGHVIHFDNPSDTIKEISNFIS